MPDMLVKLYDLPDEAPALARSHAFGVEIRRAMAPDRQRVLDWVRTQSSTRWRSGAMARRISTPNAWLRARAGASSGRSYSLTSISGMGKPPIWVCGY